MSDTISKATMKYLIDVMYGRFNSIESLMDIMEKYPNTKVVKEKVIEEVNVARSVLGIYQNHLLSTEQTDDFDGHPNTVI